MKEAKRLWSWLAIPCIALAVLTGSILPVLLVPLLLLAACKQEPPDAGSSEVSETLPEITNPTFVSVDIETLLTAAEV